MKQEPSTLAAACRSDGRGPDELRPIRFTLDIAPNALGSVLIEWGQTRVVCGVSVEDLVPRWMKEQGLTGGWLTAEYSMLPYSTRPRKARDISRGKLDGRSQEIQRLIGRSLRAVMDLNKLGSRTLWIDCDVLQADGGTRTAAITGSYVALRLALQRLLASAALSEDPLLTAVAAVSIGLVGGQVLADLCYEEDARAEVDLNIVMTATGEFIELQGTGEHATFSQDQLSAMLAAGRRGIDRLLTIQAEALPAC
jgi:ribonuclease PH